MSQLDLFRECPPIDPLHGLEVRLPDRCRCGAIRATVGTGTGPHIASLQCIYCGAHRGWVSREMYSFIAETVRLHGRPTRPIIIRRGRNGER
jgi:hypothetical protein